LLQVQLAQVLDKNVRLVRAQLLQWYDAGRDGHAEEAVGPRGGDIVLLEIQPKVYEVFQLLGFSQFFNIKDNLDEATAFFKAGDQTATASVFPKIFSCPICNKKLKAARPGRFRCSECKTILAIDNSGQVFLG